MVASLKVSLSKTFCFTAPGADRALPRYPRIKGWQRTVEKTLEIRNSSDFLEVLLSRPVPRRALAPAPSMGWAVPDHSSSGQSSPQERAWLFLQTTEDDFRD